jgi:imidazolonepropionase-like amidohydrolase
MRTQKPILALLALALVAFPAGAAAADPPLAITNARIVTMNGPAIAKGTVVVRDGRIEAVGENVAVPAGAKVMDAAGMTVYPGLIDPLTTLGLVEIPTVAGSVDTTELGTYNPTADASVAVHPHGEVIPTVRVNGVTTVLTVSRGGFISGQGAVINLVGWTPQEMTLVPRAALYVTLPHWSRVTPQQLGPRPGGAGPPTRQERERFAQQQMADLKDYLARARAYGAMKDAAAKAGKNPPADRECEALLPYLRGDRPFIVPANTPEQIKDAIAFAREMSVRLIIAGGSEAWKVAKDLAEAKVPVLIDSTDMPRQADPYDAVYANAAALARAGVKFAFSSDSASDARNLPFLAALAVAYGLSPEDALKAVTLWPAEILGIADRVGSIERGKVANLVVAGGDILDVRTPIRQVIIAGQAIEMGSRHTELYDKFKVR